MQPRRSTSIFISFFLFAATAIATHFAMDRSDYSFCGRRIVVTIVTLVALALLLIAISVRCRDEAKIQRHFLRAACYVLVVAVSAGFWFDVWATQQCSEVNRTRVDRLQH